MPRRRRNSSFLPGSSSSSYSSWLDQQNVESDGNAENLRRNTRRRLAPTNPENVTDSTDSTSDHSLSHEYSTPGIPSTTMAEEHAERLIDTAHPAYLSSDEQTINRPAPSVGGRLDYGVRSPRDPRLGARESGRNDISPPYLPFSRLSEYLEQCYSEHRRSIDFIARHNQPSSVMRSPQVDEGDLEDREDDEHEEMRRDVDDDEHEEMRRDVGDMSYAVAIGLSEEAILAGVGRHSYQLPNVGSPVEEERCCICQEEYVEGVELGKLDCGHECHFNCIEQWLMLKNACPLCKRAAVVV